MSLRAKASAEFVDRSDFQSASSPTDVADFFRLDASRRLSAAGRSEMGQYLSPPPVARFMASLFEARHKNVSLLDAGAGTGSLTAAFVDELCARAGRPAEVSVIAYEIEAAVIPYLKATLEACRARCERAGIKFRCEVVEEDFVESGVSALREEWFVREGRKFNCAILNPPYRKINSDSVPRRILRTAGIETSNLYTAFLAVAVGLLDEGGELVAITPRSFCNGPYFKPFRKSFLEAMTFRRMHVFDSRQLAFQEDHVLQENIIFHAVKCKERGAKVCVSLSRGPEDADVRVREITHDQIVYPGDPDSFIHIVPDEHGQSVAEMMRKFDATLGDLGLGVSTGRVVDFRAREFLRAEPKGGKTAPLIYPGHFDGGLVRWPKRPSRKPNALALAPDTDDLLVPRGTYVLVKRFSAKEEPKRVVAAVYDEAHHPAPRVGFENHLNYYHASGGGLPPRLAKGLAVFLNSTLVDSYFRQFNGHTQVNATDLRSLRYPALAALEALGSRVGDEFPEQDELDRIFEEELLGMTREPVSPAAKKRIEEATAVLRELGLPRRQQNERSALTLLALLDLGPETPWTEAADPLRGVTQMMEFFAERYGKRYAPNTRETVRRQTLHQFLEAGLVWINPDDPARPTNSGKTVYQVETGALKLLRSFGTEGWEKGLETYLSSVGTLKKRYAQERRMKRIPVELAPSKSITLSPGGQNVLVKQIIDEFCLRYTPGGKPIYVGDTDEKWAYFDEEALEALGVRIEAHGKMPDVVVHHIEKNWLVLIEAVTSHGPVDPKRHNELKALFKGSKAGLVFVTTFLTRKAMVKYLDEISWETEVWVAESPDHLIHFNGERFLGPYEE